ncbi:hypothetical protein KJ975_01075 [Myxococcota bacterium]|nr:hypothetical protein [Myxococcota bacterium]
MKKTMFLSTLLALFTFSLPASAKILELYLQPQVGAMGGIYSQKKLPWGDTDRALNTEEDYFMLHRGGFYGVAIGAEFMFLEGQLEVNQSFKQGGVSSTYVSFTVGLDADFEVDKEQSWTLFILGGVALGTVNDDWLEKEEPQIAHEDLDAQIALVRVGARYEYKFTSLIRLSIEGGVGAHILQLAQKAANDEDSQSSGVHVFGQVGIRFVWDVFGGGKKQASDDDDE